MAHVPAPPVVLPLPGGLAPEVWQRRHVRIVGVLVAHVPVLVAIALARDFDLPHIAVDITLPVACAALASRRSLPPRLRSIAAALGLMAAAAAFVHLMGGRTEWHFLYFVLLGVLALYDDWVPYATAVGFVLLEHGVIGALAPTSVYGNDFSRSPWLWAAVHGGFVLAASVVAMVSWRWRDTDRAEADAKLRTSEEHFRLTFEAAPIGIALVGTDGRFLEVNPALCDLLGYGRAVLITKTFQEITHPEDLAVDLDHVRSCLTGEADGYMMEKRYVHQRGHPVWVQLNVAVSRGADGRPTHFVSQILDITERRAVAASEARFAAMVEHGNDLISITDRDGRLSYASPAFETILGFAPAERLGRALDEQVHPDDRGALSATMAALTTGSSTTLRFRHAHADGSWRWVEATLTNRIDDVVVGGFVVNTRDVSDQVRALERLEFQATHDVLTGLANRTLLDERLQQVASAASRRGENVAALYIDIDNFKDINDTLGHAVGDEILVEVANRLRSAGRLDDLIARVGGDEFVVVASLVGQGSVEDIASRVCRSFAEPFDVGARPLSVTASVGAATTDCTLGVPGLLEAADLALYEAKSGGRNRWAVYRPTAVPATGR